MDRRFPRYGYLLAVVSLAAAVLPASGCRSVLATAAYLIRGTDVPGDFDGLKGKSVAVVCRPLIGLKYQDSRVAKDLAHQVSKLLKDNVKKITVVEPNKVDQWSDENTWEEYTEIGKAVGADMVLGIDLEHFEIYQGQTLYQGKANTSVRIYDCKAGGEPVFEKVLAQTVYPPNACIQTSEKQESQFRREFINVLADQIGRHFYSHDPHADIAQDAAAL